MNRKKYTRIDLATYEDQNWYQRIVKVIRRQCADNPQIVGNWPQLSDDCRAESRYPNLAAELSRHIPTAYPGNVSRAARVRERTIISAVENGASLYPYQLERMAAVLNVSVEYLSDPYIAVVDPSTKIGNIQAARLGALMKETKGLVVPDICRKYANVAYDSLCSGELVLYAAYRYVIRALLAARRHPLPNGRKPRTENKVLYIGCAPIWDRVTQHT